MLLLTHIAVAIAGIAFAVLALFSLSTHHIKIAHSLTAATVASGTALVLTGSSLLKGCVSGLLYVAIALTLTHVAGRRLAKQAQSID